VLGYGVADQVRLITKELNHKILGNQRTMYELVMALTTETSIVKFNVITIQQNFIPLATLCATFHGPNLLILSDNTNTKKHTHHLNGNYLIQLPPMTLEWLSQEGGGGGGGGTVYIGQLHAAQCIHNYNSVLKHA
jgi:hypothetical protein